MGNDRKSAAAATSAIAGIVVLLLPFVYLLSFGPLSWLHRAGYIDGAAPFWQAYCWPVNEGMERSAGFTNLMVNYVSLWTVP